MMEYFFARTHSERYSFFGAAVLPIGDDLSPSCPNMWTLHAFNGGLFERGLFLGEDSRRELRPGHRIRFELDMDDGILQISLNGAPPYTAFRTMRGHGKVYPCVGFHTPGVVVELLALWNIDEEYKKYAERQMLPWMAEMAMEEKAAAERALMAEKAAKKKKDEEAAMIESWRRMEAILPPDLRDARAAAATKLQVLYRAKIARRKFRGMIRSAMEEYVDPETGRSYLYNPDTGESVWA